MDSEVGHLGRDLEMRVGDALGVSLSEVWAQYFWDSDEGEEDSKVGRDLVEEQNNGDVITNHNRSGRYWTKNLDGVPFALYRDDMY
jgi:hypothetical protein